MSAQTIMIVGGRYMLLRAANGFKVGDVLECVGADTKKRHGEFGLYEGAKASPKMKAAVWYFDWNDVRLLPKATQRKSEPDAG